MLAFPAHELVRISQLSASWSEFVMIQLGVRGEDDPITRVPCSHAKIYVVEPDGEAFVVASELLENVGTNHLASSCNRCVVARSGAEVLITAFAFWTILVDMRNRAEWINHHSSMLYESVFVEKLRTYDANIWALQESHHFFDEVSGNDFRVVVEEEKVIARCFGGAEIDYL